MNDLRQEIIERLDFYMQSTLSDIECEVREDEMDFYKACHLAKKIITNMPSEHHEALTDKEQRIFLAAMAREEEVCRKTDDECRDCREPYEDSLVKICHEITRKVKGALWMI